VLTTIYFACSLYISGKEVAGKRAIKRCRFDEINNMEKRRVEAFYRENTENMNFPNLSKYIEILTVNAIIIAISVEVITELDSSKINER
jgi:hypothetical protein